MKTMLSIFNYKLSLSCYIFLLDKYLRSFKRKKKEKKIFCLPFQRTYGFVDLGTLTNLNVMAEMHGRVTCSLYDVWK